MGKIRLHIDGKDVSAAEGMTILEAARDSGIPIPTLCHHPKLEPFGGCRICTVEVEANGSTKLAVSCVYLVKENLVIRTRSERIDRIRKTLLELLLAHAPESLPLKELAAEYGANQNRFEKEASFCIHCGLCVRYCAEVKKHNAVGFVDRGIRKEIAFIPEIASKVCSDCQECFPLCPTSYLQATFVLTEALASPAVSSPPSSPKKQDPNESNRTG